jgi:hypothetical protein
MKTNICPTCFGGGQVSQPVAAAPVAQAATDERAGFDAMEPDDWHKLAELKAALRLEDTTTPFTVLQFAIARITRLYAERDQARAALQQRQAPAQANDEGLLPCPFCGSSNIDPAEWSGNDGAHGPGCGDCGALADSAELWNRRAPQAEAAPAPKMQVAKLTALDGSSFYTNECMSAERLREVAQRMGGIAQVDLLEMTEAEYFAIPACNESARVFGQGEKA